MAGSRRALCSLGVGPHSELLDIALPRLEAYAANFGYDVIIGRSSLAPERPPAWSKIVMMDRALSDFDFVVWVDADAILVDSSSDIADVCDPDRSIHLAVHRYDAQQVPNTGVCVLRADRHAERFLRGVWNLDLYTDHPWWDNAATLDLLGFSVRSPVRPIARSALVRRLGELPLRWNSVPAHRDPNPAIIHLAGCTHSARASTMRRLAGVTLGSPALL